MRFPGPRRPISAPMVAVAKTNITVAEAVAAEPGPEPRVARKACGGDLDQDQA